MHCSAFAKRAKYSLFNLRNLAPQAPCCCNGGRSGYLHASYLCCIAIPMLHYNLVVTYEFENSCMDATMKAIGVAQVPVTGFNGSPQKWALLSQLEASRGAALVSSPAGMGPLWGLWCIAACVSTYFCPTAPSNKQCRRKWLKKPCFQQNLRLSCIIQRVMRCTYCNYICFVDSSAQWSHGML